MNNQQRNTKSEFMGVMDISAILGMSKHVIYRLIRTEELPSYRIGGTIKVRADDLQNYVEGCRRG